MFGISLDLFILYFFLSLFLGSIYSYILYNKDSINLPKPYLVLLVLLRTFLITIISILLLSPIFKFISYESEKPIIIIAKDNTASVKDSINLELLNLKNQLENFEVHSFSFSNNVIEGINKKNTGLKTNYSNFFNVINNKFESRNVAGVVFASDGCYNAGKNPEFINYDYPIYTIALGDTNNYKDVSIDNVLYNQISFLGNDFPLEINILSSFTKNYKTKLTIWNLNNKLHEEIINLSSDKDLYKLKVKLNAKSLGFNTYRLEIDPVEGEKNISNNNYLIYIDVVDSKYKILLMKDKIHPDFSAFKSTLDKNINYELDIKNINDDIRFDSYNLVVLFGINDIPKKLNNNIPLVVFNSTNNIYNSLGSSVRHFSEGDYENISVSTGSNFSKFTLSSELLDLIESAPPLYNKLGRFAVNQNIDYLLIKKKSGVVTKEPIIFIENIGDRRVAFVTAEGWWRWKLYDYRLNSNNNRFDELFNKLTQYLVVKDDKSLFRVNYEKNYFEDDYIKIGAELYNESYELVNNRDIQLSVRNSFGEEFNFQFSKFGGRYNANLGSLAEGNYTFVAFVEDSDVNVTGAFNVQQIQLEKMDVVANHAILKNMSSKSGGNLYYKNNLNLLIKNINNSNRNKSLITEKEKFDNLINFKWILVILLSLVSLEWLVRKYQGLI